MTSLRGNGVTASATLPEGALQETIGWILSYATARDDLGELLAGVSGRLVAAGLPLWRTSLDLPTIDPNARAVMHKWWRDHSEVGTLPHGPEQAEVFQKSVIYHLISHRLDTRRFHLERGEGVSEFSLLASLRQDGATDYVIHLVRFGEDEALLRGAATSFATDREGGFSPEERAYAARVVPALGLAAFRVSAEHTARNTLDLYLGPKTARRVLAGEVRRGEGETIAAAILFADLKNFTALAEREDPVRIVGWLNEHFEALGGAVTAQGGEILKLIGDGLLAIFPVDDSEHSPRACCDAAFAAAEDALAANDDLNGKRVLRGEPALPVDIALHFGEVVYGNVGASRRLDFTVIGRAVNEACRMETLCDQLNRSIVLSEAFARTCSRPTMALGEFELRGVAGRRRVYSLA